MSVYSADDHRYMARALQLAERGLDITSPNPRVGCVLVREGRIIGEGSTQPAGSFHAEIAALIDARGRPGGDDARGATAYVTLEPCSHYGRTPPCADALINSGVVAVVAAMTDPNPLVAGQGLARLRAASIDTRCGLMAAEAAALNPGFVKRMTRGLPWVRVKLAASLDGKSALNNGVSQWITGPAARLDGHRWRARACAILTGSGTVLADDPQLSVRLPDVARPRQPLRVVVDGQLRLPVEARLLRGAQVLVATAGQPALEKIGALQGLGAEVKLLDDGRGRVDLPALMAELARRGINEVHVEAGAQLNAALLRAGLVDEFLIYQAPTLLGHAAAGMLALPELTDLEQRFDLQLIDVRRLGYDVRILARPR